jgi:hypothetical protein
MGMTEDVRARWTHDVYNSILPDQQERTITQAMLDVQYLLARVERLETLLKEMGKLAMDDMMSDRGFRHYVHNEVGFALEVRDVQRHREEAA